MPATFGLAESHAAAAKHKVITIEKTMGMIKRYLQLTNVMAAKQRANAHAVPRMSAKGSRHSRRDFSILICGLFIF